MKLLALIHRHPNPIASHQLQLLKLIRHIGASRIAKAIARTPDTAALPYHMLTEQEWRLIMYIIPWQRYH
jgi:hypothetical protein